MYSPISMEAQYTKGTAAAFFRSSSLCCLSPSYVYSKAATWFASNPTGLLNCTQQSFVPRWIKINKQINKIIHFRGKKQFKFPTSSSLWAAMWTMNTHITPFLNFTYIQHNNITLPYFHRAKFPTTNWSEVTTDRTFSCLHSSLTVKLHPHSILHGY